MLGSRGSAKGPSRQIQGWVDFDNLQRSGVAQAEIDPFPSLSSVHMPKFNGNSQKNNTSFASLINQGKVNSNSAQKAMANGGEKKTVGVNSGNKRAVVERLRKLFPWASESLIEDILSAVGSDFQRACALLEAISDEEPSAPPKCEELLVAPPKCVGGDDSLDLEGINFSDLRLSDSIPVPPCEPEWEEDDVYLKNRKEALKITRNAQHHSKKAQRAYERGDHHMAKVMSQKARELYLEAERLNAKAAERILDIRNEKHNDILILDLHGLHSNEAVAALETRLNTIEYNNSRGFLVSGCPTVTQKGDNSSKMPLTQQARKPFELQVITGSGTHSRSGASLPFAVRSFLLGKGYKFTEARPGVIAVKPKFRYKNLTSNDAVRGGS